MVCVPYRKAPFWFPNTLLAQSKSSVNICQVNEENQIPKLGSHSSTLAWKIPWMEEPGGLQSMGSLRVRHDWATSLSRVGEGNGNPLQYSCLENPRDGGAWRAAVYGVTQSRTRLKQLSSSSREIFEAPKKSEFKKQRQDLEEKSANNKTNKIA